MAAAVEHPVIFPLSNPTSRSEANPADLIAWTEGRAIVGTGSPYPHLSGTPQALAQVNNVYIFPGVGLGALSAKATRVTEGMFMAAARKLGELAGPDDGLLPPILALRDVALQVALAVADQARAEGVAPPAEADETEALAASMWVPAYR